MIDTKLYSLRKSRKKTQQEIATALQISQRSYSYYERGENTIPPDILWKLADLYDISIDFILGRTDDPHPHPKGPKRL